MALDDDEVCLKAALAVTLVVFLTLEKRRQARTLTEWALILEVLEDMETTEKEEIEDGDSPRAKRTREVPPRSDFSQAPWTITLRKAELKRRNSREYRNFRRHFRIPYEFFLELVQLAKYRKWFSLAARGVAGRQCIPVEMKVSSCCCQFCMVYGLDSRSTVQTVYIGPGIYYCTVETADRPTTVFRQYIFCYGLLCSVGCPITFFVVEVFANLSRHQGRNLSFLAKYRDLDIMAMVYTLKLPCCYLSARRA